MHHSRAERWPAPVPERSDHFFAAVPRGRQQQLHREPARHRQQTDLEDGPRRPHKLSAQEL